MFRTALCLATLATGCMGLHHSASSGSSGSSGFRGLGQLGQNGEPRRCAIRPYLFKAWDDPMTSSAECPNEGWARQLVRDSGELDPCVHSAGAEEIDFVVVIDRGGYVTDVSVDDYRARSCIRNIVFTWEFAPAKTASELRVVLRPNRQQAS